MTDNDIIKALECCLDNDILDTNCKECPLKKQEPECMDIMMKAILDIINRQKAEIERLKKTQFQQALNHYHNGITDFAKRLKREIAPFVANVPDICEGIDSLAAEMVGEGK